jgi:hypothetical protein
MIANNTAVVIDGSKTTESIGKKTTPHAGAGAAE